MWAATAEWANLKVHNMKDINAGKREYSVSNCEQFFMQEWQKHWKNFQLKTNRGCAWYRK